MPIKSLDDVIISDMSDIHDLPLDAELSIDDVEYLHTVCGTDLVAGEKGASVSAFNSSI